MTVNLVKSFLIFATICLSFNQSQAGLISSSQAFRSVSIEQKRAQILGFLERSDVAQQLTRLGVQPSEAQARMTALTDDEVLRISERLDQQPVGKDGVGSVLGFVLIIFIVLLITDILHLTKVFPFTK